MSQPYYNHAFDFAFEVMTDVEDPDEVAAEVIRAALMERASKLTAEEILQACNCFDTMTI